MQHDRPQRGRSKLARRTVLASLIGIVVGLVLAPAGQALAGPPLPGPALQTPTAALTAALSCSPDLGSPTHIPVLLVPGTGATPADDFGTNYLHLLPAWGFPYCTVTLPHYSLTDMQTTVEYVVYAIRWMAAHSHTGKIAVIGHSQGGFLPLYALKFWPDLAGKIADYIGFAPATALGTTFADTFCVAGCTPAFQQFKPGSAFLDAFNGQPYPTGPTYTSFLTLTDEIVTPQPAASTLPAPGAHTYIEQHLCPDDLAEHLTIVDEQPFAALTHQLLTDPEQPLAGVGKLPCGLLPQAAGSVPSIGTFLLDNVLNQPLLLTSKEPALRCYLSPTCPHPKLLPIVAAHSTPSRARHPPFAFTTSGTLELPVGATDQCAGVATVTIKRGRRVLSRRAAPVGQNCTFRSRVTLARTRAQARRVSGQLTVTVRYPGTDQLLPASSSDLARANAGRTGLAGRRVLA
jgi:pimeloyl-ACP methyl ester carboxylesterase